MKTDYERIEKAILYLKSHFKEQPDLDEIASQVHLSPFHFQRMFTDWAGVSPKKFIQYLSVEHAKKLLKENNSLAGASFATGLSGTSRLHDLFINIEGMTPGEYKNGGRDLNINYNFAGTPFGDVIIASTSKGICHLAFVSDEISGRASLLQHFPDANIIKAADEVQHHALRFHRDWTDLTKIKLHLKGTPFQLKVWQSLLQIPSGSVTTYGSVARDITAPLASRAVGTAVGSNPVAFLIPCHRVIKSSGEAGGYHWGGDRKVAMLGWESALRYEK